MPVLTYELALAAPLERVWDFHQQARAALAVLTPPELDLEIESIDPEPPQPGTRVILRMKGPFGRLRWVAHYTAHQPPHAVMFGEEARFVDVQESGPFARWQHEHEFERIDEKTTRMVDRITYRAPLGPIGALVDILFIRRRIEAMFRHRHAVTRKLLEDRQTHESTIT